MISSFRYGQIERERHEFMYSTRSSLNRRLCIKEVQNMLIILSKLVAHDWLCVSVTLGFSVSVELSVTLGFSVPMGFSVYWLALTILLFVFISCLFKKILRKLYTRILRKIIEVILIIWKILYKYNNIMSIIS